MNFSTSLHPGDSDQIPPDRRSSSKHLSHLVYDQLISLLENRTLENVPAGLRLPNVIHPTVRDAFRRDGMTELEIEQTISTTVDAVKDHPNWCEIRDVPAALYNQFDRNGRADEIFRHRIVAVPNLIMNALICEKLLSLFQPAHLLSAPGFIILDGDIRIDIDARLARQGFFVPVIREGLIKRLLVFRRPKDERPFILRSREVRHYV